MLAVKVMRNRHGNIMMKTEQYNMKKMSTGEVSYIFLISF